MGRMRGGGWCCISGGRNRSLLVCISSGMCLAPDPDCINLEPSHPSRLFHDKSCKTEDHRQEMPRSKTGSVLVGSWD